MIDPIPSGTRDVLPDEMRELRAITEKVRAVFDARGYGEVATPALEYETTLARGDAAAAEPAYRLFDEQGNVLVLRSDMTIPIARVVATRYTNSSPPLRFCYFAHAYRSVRPSRGQAREMLQAGIELVGAPGPEGTVEAIELLCEVLDAVGLDGYRIGLGDASLYPALLDARRRARGRARADPARAGDARLRRPGARDRGAAAGEEAADGAAAVPQLRGGAEVLDVDGPAADVVGRLRVLHERLTPRAAERVIFDLGLSRSLGYYTGAIFEVYDGALGVPLGGGGRYDDLLGRFGRDLPAAGWALNVERLHIALVGERGAGRAVGLNGLTIAVPRGALMRQTLDLLDGLGVDTAEVRANDRRLLFGEVGIVTMRPSDVPTYVEAGAADLGITGKDVLAEQVEREVYELARPRLRALRDGVRHRRGRRSRRRGAAPARRHARGDEVPAHRRRLLRAHRPPGGDRRGQGLGRARAADRAGRGHRRPHRDRHDAARERPRRPRGDVGLDRAADRQPGRPQLKAAEIDEILARIRDAA